VASVLVKKCRLRRNGRGQTFTRSEVQPWFGIHVLTIAEAAAAATAAKVVADSGTPPPSAGRASQSDDGGQGGQAKQPPRATAQVWESDW
jgi:hypothetical protein